MSSPSRRREPRALAVESHLPKGGCTFLSIHPDARCACTGFALNESIPGSSCYCGHQAAWHEPETDTIGRREFEALRSRIFFLEQELDRERQTGRERLSRLEELVDRIGGEREGELRDVYRGMGGIWQNIVVLKKRMPYYDDKIEAVADDVQRIGDRLIEVDDASMRVEDRVDALESLSTPIPSTQNQRRRASTPPTINPETTSESSTISGKGFAEYTAMLECKATLAEDCTKTKTFRKTSSSSVRGEKAWTVHVSLMPTSSQPFPFEEDTAAYKRCLSRGLHRKVVVQDTDSKSFISAVSVAFASILRGRPWRPLIARICDAKNLRGLPMLRQLPSQLVDNDYDIEFLKVNCAVLDSCGRIEDLYIAMVEDTISWPELQSLPPFLPGLEVAWNYDAHLESSYYEKKSSEEGTIGVEATGEKRPAGELLPSISSVGISQLSRTKRHASMISRTPSFDSNTDVESTRTKFRRACTSEGVELVGSRCAEIV